LRRSDCAQIVADALRHFEGERVVMISLAVMPNHVHALFVQNPQFPLEKLLQSWKRFMTREINKLFDRAGNLWQRDYFDRLVRDEQHFANCIRYIRRNPEKAKLPPNEFILWQSEIALAIT
jgi:REP element-mobilizing transposase RayT